MLSSHLLRTLENFLQHLIKIFIKVHKHYNLWPEIPEQKMSDWRNLRMAPAHNDLALRWIPADLVSPNTRNECWRTTMPNKISHNRKHHEDKATLIQHTRRSPSTYEMSSVANSAAPLLWNIQNLAELSIPLHPNTQAPSRIEGECRCNRTTVIADLCEAHKWENCRWLRQEKDAYQESFKTNRRQATLTWWIHDDHTKSYVSQFIRFPP